MNLNKVFLIGRLTQDPQLRSTPSGTPVCSFGLATNRIWKDRETGEKQTSAEYHNIVLWRKLAEIASQYLRKGSLVLIEGRLSTRTWDDSSGNRRQRTEIIGEGLQLAPKGISAGTAIPTREPQKAKSISQDEIPVIEEDEQGEIDVEKIPF